MKLVIEHYGKFILEGMVVVALMTLIFTGLSDQNGNRGIFAVTGAQIHVDGIDYHSYTDFKNSYKTESEKNFPVITFTAGRIVVGVHTLSNYVKAVDDAGGVLSVKIKSIKAPDGTEVIETYNPDTTEIALLQSGIYRLLVVAVDNENRLTETTIQMPVNSN